MEPIDCVLSVEATKGVHVLNLKYTEMRKGTKRLSYRVSLCVVWTAV
jgi:hypothetical protein